MPTLRPQRIAGGLFLAAVALKLALVRGDETVGTVWDAEHYALATRALFSDVHTLFSPGMPLWAALVQRLGVPYRLAVEMLYAAACLTLAVALHRRSGSALVAGATFTLAFFHPWVLDQFRFFTSEGLYLCLTLLLLACLLRWDHGTPVRAGAWPTWCIGGLLGFASLVRIETPLLLGVYAAFTLPLLWRRRRDPNWRGVVIALLVPLLVMAALRSLTTRWIASHNGVAALSAQTAPGLEALMGALYRVDAADSSRYAPVTVASLRAACGASPTLARFESVLLAPNNLHAQAGESFTGRPGEFGTRLNWLLLASIRDASVAESDELMRQAADEVEAALDEGRLPRRFALYPLDPNVRAWLPELPGAWVSVLQRFLTPPEWRPLADRELRPAEALLLETRRALFDEVANRRAHLTAPRQFIVAGRVRAGGGPIQLVTLEDAQGRIYAGQTPQAGQEPGLTAYGGGSDAAPRFALRTDAVGPAPLLLGVWRDQGKIARVPLAQLAEGQGKTVPVGDTGETIEVQVWRSGHDLRVQNFAADRLKAGWPAMYGWALAAAAIGAAIAGWRATGPPTWAWLAIAAMIALRLGFYALVRVNLGWDRPPYVQCWQPLQVPLALLAAHGLGASLRRGRRRTASSLPPSSPAERALAAAPPEC